MSCEAIGIPVPYITWIHNSTITLDTGGGSGTFPNDVSVVTNVTLGTIRSELTVSTATFNNTGNYICTATSPVDSYIFVSSAVALVFVLSKKCCYELCTNHSSYPSIFVLHDDILLYLIFMYVTVCSPHILIVLEPSAAPENLVAEPESTSVTLSWQPIPKDEQNGNLIAYIVSVNVEGQTGSSCCRQGEHLVPNSFEACLVAAGLNSSKFNVHVPGNQTDLKIANIGM